MESPVNRGKRKEEGEIVDEVELVRDKDAGAVQWFIRQSDKLSVRDLMSEWRPCITQQSLLTFEKSGNSVET